LKREKALEKLEPMQQGDFEQLYEALGGKPVTIRFLDPPLHEFLPTKEEDIEKLAKDTGKSVADVKAIITSLHEFNPMTVTYPEIAVMQTKAVVKAAIAVNKKGMNVVPEIMIPLISETKELAYVKAVVVETADKLIAESGAKLEYKVGTMIEIPRAALTADQVAKDK